MVGGGFFQQSTAAQACFFLKLDHTFFSPIEQAHAVAYPGKRRKLVQLEDLEESSLSLCVSGKGCTVAVGHGNSAF